MWTPPFVAQAYESGCALAPCHKMKGLLHDLPFCKGPGSSLVQVSYAGNYTQNYVNRQQRKYSEPHDTRDLIYRYHCYPRFIHPAS